MNNQPRQIGDYVTATDPTRGAMAASYAVVPGGPQNNDPQNVLSVTPGPQTYPSAYGDLVFNNVPQLQAVMPMPVSQMPQQMVMGTGFNNQTPLVQQTDPRMGDQMLGNHYGQDAARRGLAASPMGITGLSVDMGTPLPGGSVPSPQQSPSTMPLSTQPPQTAAQNNNMGSRMGRGTRRPGGMMT